MRKTLHVSGFPTLCSAEHIKSFLEARSGLGTIEALEMKRGKKGSRAYAKVQFTDSRYAKMIIGLAKNGPYYGGSFLKAFEQDNNFVPNPRTNQDEMNGITLNFGCQISEDRFSVLWKATDVDVIFGAELNKMQFFLSHGEVEYRLQLSCESVWQIVLYPNARLLLIQLFGAPRIYKKLETSIYSFYKETPEDQWVRTTDFTPSCIGQSSGLCLQLDYISNFLKNFEKDFVYYSVRETPFYLESGTPFSANLPLVPIVQPPRGLELPYRILFKICSLVQTGCLPGMKLGATFFRCRRRLGGGS